MRRFFAVSVVLGAIVLVVAGTPWAVAAAKTYQVTLDEYDVARSAPIGEIHSNTGGVGGVLSEGDWEYVFDGRSCKATAHSGAKKNGGVWYTLLGKPDDKRHVDLGAIYGPYIKSEFQGKVVAIEVVVSRVESAKLNKKLELWLELKTYNNKKKKAKLLRPNLKYKLLTGDYASTRVFRFELGSKQQQPVNQISWFVKNARNGDSITVDQVRLEVESPQLLTEEEAFLWSYSWLMGNYDPDTGMVQDKSWDLLGANENVAATAKAAKATCYAVFKGYVDRTDGMDIVTKIADTLLQDVPRGPSGKNSLWPQYTQNGGTAVTASSSWLTATSAFAAMDMIAALQMLGDPESQINGFLTFLRSIDYSALLVTEDLKNYLSRGYYGDGAAILDKWSGFGMETFGVNWAYASASGIALDMNDSPSDDGVGFVDNAALPAWMTGTDVYGNNWDSYRVGMANTQVDWYCVVGHNNDYLCAAGLFGLSAAEHPDGASYRSFGVGGSAVGADDGDNQVVVLHYSAMIADLVPSDSKSMWERLRDRTGLGSFLGDRIIISPLNNLESLRVTKDTGALTVNHLKSAWNLALQAEGWALADSVIRSKLMQAIDASTFLAGGLDVLTSTP